jgi:hypothetical protein
VKEFDKSYRKDDGSIGVEDAFISADQICGSAGSNTIPQFGSALTPSLSAALSPKATSMVQEILSATGSPGLISAKVADIQSSAAASLSAKEAAAVAGLGSIAVSSTEYWAANSDNWRALSPNPRKISMQLSVTDNSGASRPAALPTHPRMSEMACCTSVALADASAFISSLLRGWWTGSFDWYFSAFNGLVASIIAAINLLIG